MEVVQTLTDLEANLCRLDEYLNSANPEDREFARSLIRRGRCFVVTRRADGFLFGPSRFVGYKHNSRAAHRANDDKDGKETNPAISLVLGRERVDDADLEEEYRLFCKRLGVEYNDLADKHIRRRYWLPE